MVEASIITRNSLCLCGMKIDIKPSVFGRGLPTKEKNRHSIKLTTISVFAGLASTYPEPTNVRQWLEDQLYNFNYESSMPITWKWPKAAPMKTRELIPTKLTEKEETV